MARSLRPPFSQDRLSLLADGRVRYRLRRPWPTPEGAEALVLEPVPFLKRLTALMSRPYVNNVRYHGVFANRSKDRPRLPPPPSLSSQVPASSAPDPLHDADADVTLHKWLSIFQNISKIDLHRLSTAPRK